MSSHIGVSIILVGIFRVRVRSLLEHGKGEVDGVAGAIASGGADELSRLDSIMSEEFGTIFIWSTT